jgi:transcriptional regulator GlxA family with amidase domain
MPDRDRPSIVLLAAAETSPAVLYGLFDVLSSVGAVFPDMTLGHAGEAALDVRIAAVSAELFRCVGAVLVEPHAALADLPHPDAVVACDLYTPIDASPGGRYAAEVAWLREAHAHGALVASVCTGALLLAEAGLLDGRNAATHWAYRDLFRRLYPTVRLQEGSALCLAGAAEGVITAGGVTAWQDLALHLIARLCGRRRAIETAKVFLISGHDEGQSPYAVFAGRANADDALIATCQRWLADNYAVASPVTRMARRAGLSERSFARRFRAATGYAPMTYVQALRVEEAKQMLETGEAGVERIAAAVGYEDPTSFRRIFKRHAGLTPAAYRRRFRRIVAATPASAS